MLNPCLRCGNPFEAPPRQGRRPPQRYCDRCRRQVKYHHDQGCPGCGRVPSVDVVCWPDEVRPCRECTAALGLVHQSPRTLRALASYLEAVTSSSERPEPGSAG